MTIALLQAHLALGRESRLTSLPQLALNSNGRREKQIVPFPVEPAPAPQSAGPAGGVVSLETG